MRLAVPLLQLRQCFTRQTGTAGYFVFARLTAPTRLFWATARVRFDLRSYVAKQFLAQLLLLLTLDEHRDGP